jgi:CHASE2 domain-containing sensor protein
VSPPDGPYVGLDCFREEDAGLFFGRDAERTRIIGNLRASRLTLLHAESGVGKSSLLRAGVSARLNEPAAGIRGGGRYVTVVFNGWGPSPTAALIESLAGAARRRPGAEAAAPRRDGLAHAIADVSDATDATLLVILDQFEERFLYASTADDSFDDELAACIVDRAVPAHFLISVREDAYALIGERFKSRIPNVYGNYLHLDFLDEGAARRAVVEPVAAFNRLLPEDEARWDIEPALVDAVLGEVRRGRVTIGEDAPAETPSRDGVRVETAYLQLVMQRIWDEETTAGSRVLRVETLRRLGGAGTIVRTHVDDALTGMPDAERDAAAEALRFLVTSGGRKIALSTTELREFTDAPAQPLESALERLERHRILRPVAASETDGAVRRELYHDVLASAVLDWRRRHVEERERQAADRKLAEARGRARVLEVRNRRLAAAVIALAAAIVGLGLYLVDPTWLQRLDLRTVDARLAVQDGHTADPRVALIAVDDATLNQRAGSNGRLPRSDYATILDRVRRDGPAVMALDVIFRQAGDPAEDRQLQSAIRRSGQGLVLPYDDENLKVLREADGDPTVRAQLFGETQPAAFRTGYAGLPDDPDDTIRRANLVVDIGRSGAVDLSTPTFAFTAADIARGEALRGRIAELSGASRRAVGEQSDRTTWIDLARRPDASVTTPALDVLEGRAPPDAFRGKLVVIGVTASDSPDVHRTPVEAQMPGVELQAAAIATMFRDAPVRDTSQLVDVLTIVVIAALGAAVALLALPLSIVAFAAVALAFLATAQYLFAQQDLVLAVAAPLLALALAFLGVVAFTAIRTARRHAGG